jgi:hypothetical protein
VRRPALSGNLRRAGRYIGKTSTNACVNGTGARARFAAIAAEGTRGAGPALSLAFDDMWRSISRFL